MYVCLSIYVSVTFPIAITKTVTMATLKRKGLLGACLKFEGLEHDRHGREHGSRKEDMVLEQ